MKKIFTLKKSLFVAAMLLMAAGARAQISFKYIPIWGQLRAHPISGGKVYAEMVSNGSAPEGNNYGTPAAVVDVKFAFRNLASFKYGNFRAVAVPNEAWQFAGFATQQYVDGDPVVPTKAEWADNNRSIRVTSQAYGSSDFDTPEDAFKNFPDEPDEVFYALFTRVTVGIDYFNEQLGSVEIDRFINDVGQKVTLTATPKEGKKATFSHWVEKSTGNKITQNPYSFDVASADHYTAVFTSENLVALEFPEEGGIIEFYKEENLIWFPETVKRMNFMEENLKKTGTQAYFEIENYTKTVPAKTATYLYGEGTQYLLDDPDDKTSSQMYMATPSEFWSGDKGVKLDTMKVAVDDWGDITEYDNVSGYLYDKESNTFKRIEDGMVPAGRVFLAIPKYFLDQLEEGYVPDVIYLTEEEAEAASIDGVQADNAVKNGKVYTIDGKQVAAPKQKGVYIYDGKKLIVR